MDTESLVLAEQRMLNAWRRYCDAKALCSHLGLTVRDKEASSLALLLRQCECDMRQAIQLHDEAYRHRDG